ncbi:MAG: beta family protein [Anaerolineaceae bacterium]
MNLQSYIPCLRWKLGEYQALSKLSPATKESIMPLIEVAEISYDFEKKETSKNLDEHLISFAKKVKEKWGRKTCFIDIQHIEPYGLMSSGQHPAKFVFEDLRLKGVCAVPVIRLNLDSRTKNTFIEIINVDRKGLCIRVNVDEVTKEDFSVSLKNMIRNFSLANDQCDLIIDLQSPNFKPLNGFANLLSKIITKIPNLDEWRTFGIIGTSFPSTMGGLSMGISTIPRDEWCLYKLLFTDLRRNAVRIPNFGDYAINYPEILSLDMRLVKPSASVRYSINDKWLIAKGRNVRDYGFGQYIKLCKLVVETAGYCGPGFSAGDEYINDCANGKSSTGNLSTWRWVGTNHHIEMVVHDLATLYAF